MEPDCLSCTGYALLAEKPATSRASQADQTGTQKRETAGFRCGCRDEARKVSGLTVLQAEHASFVIRQVGVDDKGIAGLTGSEAIGVSEAETECRAVAGKRGVHSRSVGSRWKCGRQAKVVLRNVDRDPRNVETFRRKVHDMAARNLDVIEERNATRIRTGRKVVGDDLFNLPGIPAKAEVN